MMSGGFKKIGRAMGAALAIGVVAVVVVLLAVFLYFASQVVWHRRRCRGHIRRVICCCAVCLVPVLVVEDVKFFAGFGVPRRSARLPLLLRVDLWRDHRRHIPRDLRHHWVRRRGGPARWADPDDTLPRSIGVGAIMPVVVYLPAQKGRRRHRDREGVFDEAPTAHAGGRSPSGGCWRWRGTAGLPVGGTCWLSSYRFVVRPVPLDKSSSRSAAETPGWG